MENVNPGLRKVYRGFCMIPEDRSISGVHIQSTWARIHGRIYIVGAGV